MSDDKLLNIYEQLKNNSIGTEKVSKYNKRNAGTILKSTILSLTALLCMAGAVGCKNEVNNNTKSSDVLVQETDDYVPSIVRRHNYKNSDIILYEEVRVNHLMESYNLTDYYSLGDGIKRTYNYSKDVYEKMNDLDETYISGFYYLCDMSTVNTVCNALGYKDLKAYIVEKGFVNDNGEANISGWLWDELDSMSDVMYQEGYNDVRVK